MTKIARAITKGIKDKEMDDLRYNTAIFFSIVGSIILGVIFKSWVIGIIGFLVFGILAWKKWYRE